LAQATGSEAPAHLDGAAPSMYRTGPGVGPMAPMGLGAALAVALPQALLGLSHGSVAQTGIVEKPDLFAPLTRASSFEGFQRHTAQVTSDCPEPCAAQAAAGAAGRYRFREERAGRVDVAQCAADFPDFLVYLERAWGDRKASAEDLHREPETKFGGGRMGVALELRPNGNVRLNMFQAPRGEPAKRVALLKVLRGVVERQQENLRPELERLGGNVSLYWRFMNGDCPESRLRVGLPLHGYSSDQTRADVAMPDFTFEYYRDIHSQDEHPGDEAWKSDAWGDVSDRLREIKKEKLGFIWRGSLSNHGRQRLSELVNAGPPEHLRPLLAEAAPDGFDVTLTGSGGGTAARSNFVSLYEQCKYKYTFHVPGKHYSAMLKYKLACNQTVFMVRKASKLREEFFYEALHHGSEIFYIKEDLSDLWEVIEEALSPADGLPAGARAARVAAGGRRVADTYLSRRGIDCYVMLYLQRYYFPFWERASKCRGGSCDVSPSSIALSRAAGDGGRLCASSDVGECDCERDETPSVV